MNDTTNKPSRKSAGRLRWYDVLASNNRAPVEDQPEFESKASALKWLKDNKVAGECLLVREVVRVRMVIPPRPAPIMEDVPLDGVEAQTATTPASFYESMADIDAGRTVPPAVALTEEPPQ